MIETRPAAAHADRPRPDGHAVVSRGPEEAEVPDVIGLAEAEAHRAAAGRRLRGRDRPREESDGRRSGHGDRHGPGGGHAARRKGETVTLTIAKAAAPRSTCPTCAATRSTRRCGELGDAGLQARQRERTVDLARRGRRRARPGPGVAASCEKGSTVTIVVGVFDDSQLDPEPERHAEPTPTRRVPGRRPPTPMRVAVLSGGRSSEHEVSLASGAAVRAGRGRGRATRSSTST